MSFLRNLRSEFLKVKHTDIGWVAAGTGILIPLLVSWLYYETWSAASKEVSAEVPWQTRLLGDLSTLTGLILPITLILITSLTLNIEHRNNAWKQVLASPRRKPEIWLTKFLVIQSYLLGCFLLISILLAAAAWLNNHPGMTGKDPLQQIDSGKLLSVIWLTWLSLLPACLIQFALSLAFRNILYPIGIGLALMVVSLFASNSTNAIWFPYLYPREILFEHYDANRATARSLVPTQVADVAYVPRLKTPRFTSEHPLILFDEGHGNHHRITGSAHQPGSYNGFARLAEQNGCRVQALKGALTAEQLQAARLLVIANPTSLNSRFEPFTIAEKALLRDWVEAGGALLLITDHFPYSKEAESLAALFDVEFTVETVQGSLQRNRKSSEPARITYTGVAAAKHPITVGLDTIITYTGQGVRRIKGEAARLLPLPSGSFYTDCYVKVRPARDYAQLLVFPSGKGRVAVTGEAAFLTAQLKTANHEKIGVNNLHTGNEQLCFNLIDWLCGAGRD